MRDFGPIIEMSMKLLCQFDEVRMSYVTTNIYMTPVRCQWVGIWWLQTTKNRSLLMDELNFIKTI